MSKPKFKPFADRCLVLLDNPKEVSTGGVILPDDAKGKPITGTVVVLGTGVTDRAWECAEGDKVGFSQYAGTEIELEGVSYKLLRQSDLLGKHE